MGWKREEMIIYYSEFLGRRDKIDDEDMLTLEDKTRLEKELEELRKNSFTKEDMIKYIQEALLEAKS